MKLIQLKFNRIQIKWQEEKLPLEEQAKQLVKFSSHF